MATTAVAGSPHEFLPSSNITGLVIHHAFELVLVVKPAARELVKIST
jgi:hypothetical protein